MTFVAARLLPAFASAMLLAGTASSMAAAAGWEESGQASWYGGKHNGRRTSSGETFNQNDLTAAHPSLPLGSRVRVTMHETGESVVVRITDRQPYHGYRIIDLSRGAAAQIGLLGRGTGTVTLTPVRADEPMEVAEAPDYGPSYGPDYGDGSDQLSAAAPRRHGRRHMRHGARAASAARPCCHAPFVTQVRRSVRHQAARHRL